MFGKVVQDEHVYAVFANADSVVKADISSDKDSQDAKPDTDELAYV